MSQLLDGFKSALADRYAIDRELGQGGMATVYLARDLKHNRPVAINVLKPELAASIGADRFLAEIEITANLQHPHILPLHDSGQADGWLYYVMPYVEGESLRDRIDREGRLEVGEAVGIAREVADALAYAHEQGVIHRDIKPGNLLLVAGHAVVADFGIARAVTEAGGDGLTGTGTMVGSSAYMSPEQAQGQDLDGRADLYALGCVLHEMLTGEPPFTGSGLAVLSSHLSEEPPTVRATRAEVPKELDRIIGLTLAKSPADRPATGRDLGEALKAAARGEALRRHGTLPITLIAYVGGGWGLFQSIDWLRRELLLPDWVRQGALALLLVGLPILLATALLQGRRSGRAIRARRLLSWRNALAAGVLAFAALGLGAGGYLASRALGVGPAATLVAQGVLEERDPLILADFEGADSVLARAATDALRIDLESSEAITLLPIGDLRAALDRMQRDPGAPLHRDVAIEVAIREGIKGVITGSIQPAGSRLVLTVQLLSPAAGEALVSDRETAADEDAVIEAIDRLSERLLERLGESVASIRARPPLAKNRTASIEALRKLTDGIRAENAGDPFAALALYEDAVRIDTTFLFAYRKIGVMLYNRGIDRGRQISVITRAFDLRERLQENERLSIEAMYHGIVTGDLEQAVLVLERQTQIKGGGGRTNLASTYSMLGEYRRADSTLRELDEAGLPLASTTRAYALMALGEFDGATAILYRLAERAPEDYRLYEARATLAIAQGDYEAAAEQLQVLSSVRGQTASASRRLGNLAAIRGRMAEAASRFEEVFAARESQGRFGDYLEDVAWLAGLEAVVAGDEARALARIEEAFRTHPLESLLPHDRPYDALAVPLALVGRTREARALLAAYEAEIQPRNLRREIPHLRATAITSLAEADPAGALADLKRMEVIPARGCRPLCTLPIQAEAYEMLGQRDSAVVAYERYLSTPSGGRGDPVYLASVYERLAAHYDERGDPDAAARYYRALVELWAEADEELQPRVRAARERLEQIQAEGG